MLRIHSEMVFLLAFAACATAFMSSGVNRTGTMRPFASPFGSLGRPTFLGLFRFKVSIILNDGGPDCGFW